METSLGFKAYLLMPTLEDILYSFSRRTQVIYPKDVALMAIKLGAGKGKRCLEGGTGSGFVTATLSWFGCEVHTFEVRREHLETARLNLRKFGLNENVTFVKASLKEVAEVYPKEYFDLAIIDVGDPWKVIDSVWEVLKGGSSVAFWVPTFNQLEKLKAAIRGKFIWIEALEVSERRLKVEEGATRPEQFGITFTGYMAIVRKVNNK